MVPCPSGQGPHAQRTRLTALRWELWQVSPFARTLCTLETLRQGEGPGEEHISGHGFPLFFLPWTVLGCHLQVADGGQRTHHWGIHPPTGKHERRCLWYHKGQLSLLADVGVGEGSVTGWL